MTETQIAPRTFVSGALRGDLTVPGDKSISHRALMLAAHGLSPVRIANLNPGRDVRATLEALLALGASCATDGADIVVSGGRLRESPGPLDCMNSGSTARMMLGLCAGANIRARFDGDDSLRKRPMEPVAAQLRAFGAKIRTTDGRMPVEFLGTPEIQTTHFILVSASAQIKSALLLAGLYAATPIVISGDRASRDHTERLLQYFGADITWDGKTIALKSTALTPRDIDVAGDASAAAFFITAATITPQSEIVIRNAGVNPTRTGLIDGLLAMGAAIELRNARTVSGEPVADIAVRHAQLHGTTIGGDLAVRAIDEIPLLAVAAAFAQGSTKMTGIGELRTKESDRIAAIERLLAAVGIAMETLPNGIVIQGGTPQATGRVLETEHDHRTAMAAAVLACAAGPITIDRADSIDVSFPAFIPTLESVQRS